MDNNLPKPPKAVGNYTTIKRVNNIIYTSVNGCWSYGRCVQTKSFQ